MASYKLISSDGEWSLEGGENLIGRFSHCPVQIEGVAAAGEHARIDLAGDSLVLTDLGSDAGTYLDGVRVRGTVPLRTGQSVRVGSTTFRLERASTVLGLPGTSGSVWGRALRRVRSAGARLPLKRARRIARVAVPGALAAFVLLLLVLRLVYNADRLRRDVVRAIESALGHDAEIGALELHLFSGRTELRDLVIHNPPEFGGEPLLKVPVVKVRFHSGWYLGTLGRSLRADVTLYRPVLMLERDERGRWNVGDLARAMMRKVIGAGEELEWNCPYSALRLRIRAREATVRVRDDLVGESREITGIVFDADLPDLDSDLTFRMAAEVPVAGLPGRIEATGSFRLFKDGRLTAGSVKGRVLALRIEGLDLRAVPVLSSIVPRAFARDTTALDLDLLLSAESLQALSARIRGRLRRAGGLPGRTAGPGTTARSDVAFEADLTGALLTPFLSRGELTVRGPAWEFTCQGRVIPVEGKSGVPAGGASSSAKAAGDSARGSAEGAKGGADVLDIDASLRAPVAALGWFRGLFPGLSGAPVDGELVVKLSTTGSTRKLDVRAEIRAEGLACPGTGAPPEDVSLVFRGTAGLVGWTGLDSISVKSLVAEASFIHAAVAPGEILSLARPELASARLGPLEFDLDLGELARRYGPLLPPALPRAHLHGWAELTGSGGKFSLRHAVESREGFRTEGSTGVRLAADGSRLDVDWRVSGPEDFDARIYGSVVRKGSEPEFDLGLSASGDLSRALDIARPYLGPVGAVWARGRFNLADARLSGTPLRFSTTGRLELLEPELWGGDPTTPPFSESRLDAIWNLDFDLSGDPALGSGPQGAGRAGPIRMRANLLKASSSTFQFRLEGEVEDLRRGLGRYDLRVFADLDKIGSALKKLGLVPPRAALRGTMDVELAADTRRGDIRLKRLEIDTPFIRVEGEGELHHVPLAGLLGASEGSGAADFEPGDVSGRLSISATVNMEEIGNLARAFARGGPSGLDAPPEAADSARLSAEQAGGEIRLDLTGVGSGRELLISGKINLDDFVGRLGPHVRKSAGERASLRFSASVTAEGADLVTLRSGTLTLGGADSLAKFALEGRLSHALDGFEISLASERFAVAPVAALFPGLAPGCTGEAGLDLRSRGKLSGGRLVPGTLELDGEVNLSGVELSSRAFPALRVRADGKLRFARRGLSAKGLALRVRVKHDTGSIEELGTLRFEALEIRSGPVPPGTLGPGPGGTGRLRGPQAVPDKQPGVSGEFDCRADEFDLGALVAAIWRGKGSAASSQDIEEGLQVSGASSPDGVFAPAGRGRTGQFDPRALQEAVILPLGLSLKGRVAVGSARVWPGRCSLEKLHAKLSLAEGRLDIRGLTAGLWGGRLSGGGRVDFTGVRPRARGELALEGIDLAEAAKAAGIPGALRGHAHVLVGWEGEGLRPEDFERSWRIDVDGRTTEVVWKPEAFPLAREVKIALEKVLGGAGLGAESRSGAADVRVTFRRGRASVETAEFEFQDGLRLAMRGRTELDGRIAAWITVKRLPAPAGRTSRVRRAILEEFVRREAFRFAVTGTWAEPVVDVKGLLWILPGRGAQP